MKLPQHAFCLTIPYGAVVAAGGVVGYLKSRSLVSLLAGGSSGGVLLLLGFKSLHKQKQGDESQAGETQGSLAIAAVLAIGDFNNTLVPPTPIDPNPNRPPQ